MILENSLNNNSIVCKLYYFNFSILFTGDIERVAENQILKEYQNQQLKLQSTILKVGHHGSRTSSTEEWVQAVIPKVALIGVGKNNKFGHPNDEIIERLQSFGVQIYRTDQMGEITIFIHPKKGVRIKKQISNGV